MHQVLKRRILILCIFVKEDRIRNGTGKYSEFIFEDMLTNQLISDFFSNLSEYIVTFRVSLRMWEQKYNNRTAAYINPFGSWYDFTY